MEKIKYNKIKAVLAEKNVTSKALAAAINITPTTVSRWCTNDSQPSIENLFVIANYLETDACSLLMNLKKTLGNS